MIEFRVLGPVEVALEGTVVPVAGGRARALLTALLVQGGGVVPTDRLVDLLWEESAPQTALNALHQVVRRLRAQLGPVGALVETTPAGYRLRTGDATVDADVFESEIRAARDEARGDPLGAALRITGALALWRGPAFGEFADGLAQAPAVRLEELRLSASESRVAHLLAAGAVDEAVAGARDLVAARPDRSGSVGLLMQALHAGGRTADALGVYRDFRGRLADELGLDPPRELRDLHDRILRDEPEDHAPTGPERSRAGSAVPGRSRTPTASGSSDLPWLPGSFLGREEDLRLVQGCLRPGRCLTLVGPGGVGKTRLAVEAARQAASQRAPVRWADLSTIGPEHLASLVAEALGVEVPGGDGTVELARALHDHHGLLVLDNAETMLGEVATLVEQVTTAAPGLALLATSRERLGAVAEHAHVVAPFPAPVGADVDSPAVRLFLDRAPDLEPEAVDEDVLVLVGELCRRLDGLPLAIELGAARAPSFGLAAFVREVGASLDLVGGGRRTAAERHRTLRAVVDWSYGLLTEDEAELFQRLAVFPMEFSVDQAAAVCGDAALPRTAVAPLLARLVEQSLVQPTSGRFRLLETLRTYARERLDRARLQALAARHAADTAERLSGLLAQMAGENETAAVAAIGALVPDLHAAWDYAVRHDRELGVRLAADVYDYAYQRQRRDLLEWGVVASGWQIDDPRLPSVLAAAAAAAWADGRLADARDLADRGMDVATDALAACAPATQRANLAMFEGRYDEAIERHRAVVEVMRAHGAEVGALFGELSVCQSLVYAGRAEEALHALAPLVRRAGRLGVSAPLAWAHFVHGEALADTDPRAARAAYDAALAEGRRTDNRLFMTLARTSIVGLAVRGDDVVGTLTDADEVLAVWQEIRNEAANWGVMNYLAQFLVRTGHERDGLVLAGAVRAHRDRHPMIDREETRLDAAVAHARDRVGNPDATRALDEGAALSYPAAVAHARDAIRAAQTRLVTSAPPP